MKIKYRILENANEQFMLERKWFFIWLRLNWFGGFGLLSPRTFSARDDAVAWVNKYNKRELYKINRTKIVKCVNLIPEEND